jgi:hypothetical protein
MDKTAADIVVTALGDHKQVPLFSVSPQALSISDAYRVTAQLRSTFEAGAWQTRLMKDLR